MSHPASRHFAQIGRRCAAAAAAFLLVAAAHAQLKVGDAFPPLSAFDLGRGLPRTEGRVLLVDFWASWCAPCKASFPAYGRIHADYAARGLTIIAVSVDEDPAAYTAFVKKMAPPFVTALDRDHGLVRRVQVPAMPTCYLIGRDGRIRMIHQGFHSAGTERELRSEIAALLAEKN